MRGSVLIGDGRATAVARRELDGLRVGARVEDAGPVVLYPCDAWLGRVLPLTFRTYWSAAACTSSGVAGGEKLWS